MSSTESKSHELHDISSAAPLTVASLNTVGSFSLNLCTDLFLSCSLSPSSVPVLPFLRACLEIKKIVSALGTILGFASIEITDKVGGVLIQYNAAIKNRHISINKPSSLSSSANATAEGKDSSGSIHVLEDISLQSMLTSEISIKGGIEKQRSAARELFRLLWTLDFITALINGLANDPTLTLKAAAVSAYASTLSPHHGKLVRMTVSAALMLLPDRHTFLKSIAGKEGGEEKPEFVARLKDLTGSFAPVQESLWRFYRDHGLAEGKLE
jgi:hypothetical protein